MTNVDVSHNLVMVGSEDVIEEILHCDQIDGV